jgi:hypothetical protein
VASPRRPSSGPIALAAEESSLGRASQEEARGRIALWIKVLYTLFLGVLVPVYWRHYGPGNFLWASDMALFFVLAALWGEAPLPNSMMAVGVLPFEIVWALDLLSGSRMLGMTSYMFEAERPLLLRSLSLFHLALPVVMVFLLRRLGYDRRALAAQTLLTWIVLPVTYLVTAPVDNVNLAFGLGNEPQTAIHPLLYLVLEMILLPVVVCWPMHLVLKRLFGRLGRTARNSKGGWRSENRLS